MLAECIQGRELINFDEVTGFPILGKNRFLAMGTAALARLGDDLIISLGHEQTSVIMTRYGYQSGIEAALNIADMYEFDTPEEWFRAGIRLQTIGGMANCELSELKMDYAAKTLSFSGHWRNSIESTLHNHNATLHEIPACWIIPGFLSGYASTVLGEEVIVRENTCQLRGHPVCTFEGRNMSQWGAEAEILQQSMNVGRFKDEIKHLREVMEQANERLEMQRHEITALREHISRSIDDSEIIFRSEPMRKLLLLAEKVAPTRTTVLIQGESGTGKELIARFIHRNSRNADHPFLAINCAALPPNLLESELFGHVKGAFTGADRGKAGLFTEAGEGTIFMDEVGELSLDIQAKLLRVLQEREVRPLGGLKNFPVKARIMAATNRDLRAMVTDGRFREDLYYRVAVFPLSITPLNERRQDILILARHFLNRLTDNHPGFDPKTVRLLENYAWPGNVRELENCVEYAVILAGNGPIKPEHLPSSISAPPPAVLFSIASDLPTFAELQRRYMKLVLEHTDQDRIETARILDIGTATLYRWLKSENRTEEKR